MSELTPYQLRIANLVAQGCSNREAAAELGTSEQAIKSALHAIFDKAGCWNRVELATQLLQHATPKEQGRSLERIEAARVTAVQQRRILDSAAECIFDEMTNVLVSVFDVPLALVGFMDSQRLWFKSSRGLDVVELPRELTICQHTLLQSQVLVVPNAPLDPRFGCSPLVKQFNVHFYAAAPILTSDGYALGVVCIVDHAPRDFSASQLSVLTSLARVASQQLEMRRELLDQKKSAPEATAPPAVPITSGRRARGALGKASKRPATRNNPAA